MYSDSGDVLPRVLKARNYASGFHVAYQHCKPGVFFLENQTIPEIIPFVIPSVPFEIVITDGVTSAPNDGYLTVQRASFVIEVDPLSKRLKAVHMTDRLRSELSNEESIPAR